MYGLREVTRAMTESGNPVSERMIKRTLEHTLPKFGMLRLDLETGDWPAARKELVRLIKSAIEKIDLWIYTFISREVSAMSGWLLFDSLVTMIYFFYGQLAVLLSNMSRKVKICILDDGGGLQDLDKSFCDQGRHVLLLMDKCLLTQDRRPQPLQRHGVQNRSKHNTIQPAIG